MPAAAPTTTPASADVPEGAPARAVRAARPVRSAADTAAVRAVIGAAAHTHLLQDCASGNGLAAYYIAEAPWVTTPSVRILAGKGSLVRISLATNPATPPELLAQMALHPNPDVRAAAGRNPSCPFGAAAARGGDDITLAHPDCPTGHLEEAFHSPDTRRLTLANPNLPRTLIDAAWGSFEPADVPALLARPDLTHPDALTLLALLDRLPGVDLPAQWDATAQWCQHPAADPGWLLTQTEDALPARCSYRRKTELIMAGVAANPAAPPAALALIAASGQDASPIALAHPACPPAAMHAALNVLGRGTPLDIAAAFIPTSVQIDSITKLATNPAAPRDVLHRLTSEDLTYIGDDTTEGILAFTHAHAATAAHAHVLLGLLPSWTQSLGAVLDAADDILAG